MTSALLPQWPGTDCHVRISGMVVREKEALTIAKSGYDAEFPEHVTDLSQERLIGMARVSLLEKLCQPPETIEEEPQAVSFADFRIVQTPFLR